MTRFIALIGMILLLAGCQSTSTEVGLPPPSFSRQTVQAAHPVTPPPIAPRPIDPIKPPASQPVAVAPPAGWVPKVQERQWQWIVIHHSSTAVGGAKSFDQYHREKGWDGLGYDFVIGNGSDTADGLVEVGPRWTQQKTGAHAESPGNQINETGIGICLVGDFEVTRPSAKQMASLARLVAFLQKRYDIPADHVIGHKDVKSTDCPGRNLNLNVVRQMAAKVMAGGNTPAIR